MDSKGLILSDIVVRRAGTIALFLLGYQPPIDCSKIPAPCWDFKTICGGQEPNKIRVVVPAHQATSTKAGGIDSLELILGLLQCLNIRARVQKEWGRTKYFPADPWISYKRRRKSYSPPQCFLYMQSLVAFYLCIFSNTNVVVHLVLQYRPNVQGILN